MPYRRGNVIGDTSAPPTTPGAVHPRVITLDLVARER
jgi:hypothetical protein